MAKDNYIFHFDDLELLEDMTDEEIGVLFKDIIKFAKDGTEPEYKDRFMRNCFKVLSRRHEFDKKAYEERCRKNSNNAKKRWDATVSDRIQSHDVAMRTDAKDANIELDIELDKELDKELETEEDIESLPAQVRPVPLPFIQEIKERVVADAEVSELAESIWISPASIKQDAEHIYISMAQKKAVEHIKREYGEYFIRAVYEINPDFKGSVAFAVG